MTHNLQETPAPEANGGPADGILRLIVEGLIARVEGSPLMGRPPGQCSPEEQERLVALLSALPTLRAGQRALSGLPGVPLALVEEIWPELGAALSTSAYGPHNDPGGPRGSATRVALPLDAGSMPRGPETTPLGSSSPGSVLVQDAPLLNLEMAPLAPLSVPREVVTLVRGARSKRSWRAVLLSWAVTILGCLVLLASPRLPWVTSAVSGEFIMINGFNGASVTTGSGGLLAQITSLGARLSTDAPLASSGDDGSSGVLVIPSLSTIPPTLGGTDSGAKWGVFVLVLGALALFVALWTLWGETGRRRSMAGAVFILGALALVPLLHELSKTGLTGSSAGQANGLSLSTGLGLFAGLAGAIATMVGSGLLYRALRRVDAL